MSRQLPDKLFFRIGEVSQIVGVQPYVLRYWETHFRSVRPEKSQKGQRVYKRRDVETLLKVKDLLYGYRFTIAGAKRRLRDEGIEPHDTSDPIYREVAGLRAGMEMLRADIVAALAQLDGLRGS